MEELWHGIVVFTPEISGLPPMAAPAPIGAGGHGITPVPPRIAPWSWMKLGDIFPRWWFQIFLCSSLFREDSHFDSYSSIGLKLLGRHVFLWKKPTGSMGLDGIFTLYILLIVFMVNVRVNIPYSYMNPIWDINSANGYLLVWGGWCLGSLGGTYIAIPFRGESWAYLPTWMQNAI